MKLSFTKFVRTNDKIYWPNRSRESLWNWFAVFQINHNIHFTWTSNWKSVQFHPIPCWELVNTKLRFTASSCIIRRTVAQKSIHIGRGRSHHFSLSARKEAWWIGNVFRGEFVWWNQNLASFNLFHCGHVIIINAKAVNRNIIIAKIKIVSIVYNSLDTQYPHPHRTIYCSEWITNISDVE